MVGERLSCGHLLTRNFKYTVYVFLLFGPGKNDFSCPILVIIYVHQVTMEIKLFCIHYKYHCWEHNLKVSF